ncbi:hypothetical protein STAS_31501 [Striga asiatica]|uniref:Uncharacterized protein n=1 Tax=Striga asiatica TaxID=4170 RepID=A0A5A7RCA4_STRAF|nr:hypothetical protein STAS_31501 [Striga asiatica]
MEALWNLEDKLNLTTRKAVAFFACTVLLAFGLCLTVVYFRRKILDSRASIHQEPCKNETSYGPMRAGHSGRCSVVRALMRALRWSGPSSWASGLRGSRRSEAPTSLLVKKCDNGGDVGWQSNNSTSAVWKKPILMGGKCEFPRFSGLILYDERGAPLDQQCELGTLHKQEISPPAVRTTLRDLL